MSKSKQKKNSEDKNMTYSEKNPWIIEREATICGWKPDYMRGFINNPNVDIKTDFFSFSNRQIREYVRMMKACGFTGIQINDSCDKWRFMGSWELVHDRFKVLFESLHEEGMNATLSVMGAFFSGHGWVDEDVTYTPREGYTAFTDPIVHEQFLKYYNIYADLAPYVDKLVIRFFDPGALRDYSVIFQYAHLLADMFKAANPKIEFAIDTWGCPDDFPEALVKEPGFAGMYLLELPFPPRWEGDPQKRARFRQGVKDLGCKLGAWGWYITEKETDQSGSMYVNARMIKQIYNQARTEGDDVMVPTYWSEMDANHVMNVFSMYSSAQLLINPDADPDQLIYDCCRKIFGEKHAKDAQYCLDVIQDARTGKGWNTYWLSVPNTILGGPNPEDIAERAAAAMEKMTVIMNDRHMEHPEMPLPVEPHVVARLIVPQLDQIRRFAEFRVGMKRLEKMYDDGADKDTLYKEIDKLWVPIPDFNGVIGVWGQIEQRHQTYYVRIFCKKAGIPIPKRPARRFMWMKRFYEHLGVIQRGHKEPVHAGTGFFEGGYPFMDENDEIVNDMIDLGVFEKLDDGKICIADWETYKYDFCIW